MLSIIIPSRNEKFLTQTVKDLLAKAKGDIEILVILDGYWPNGDEIVNDPRVHYIHRGKPLGLRNAVSSSVEVAKGEYIMKIDAHCMFAEGYDVELVKSCEPEYVVIPRRYALDAENWKIEERKDDKYPIDYMYIKCPIKGDDDLAGEVWKEKNNDPELEKKKIDELMTFQGSCWVMRKAYFKKLGLFDEKNYGTFRKEPQEISFKAWLSGGKVVRNKNTWYAHLHKSSRGYSPDKADFAKGDEYNKKWLTNAAWDKQTKDFRWLIEKFNPPGWENFKWEKHTLSVKHNKVYQNIVMDGSDIGQNPKKKDSKFWNEGKWKNFIEPLLPENVEDQTFVEVGCNAGLFLKLATERGYRRVFGVDSDKRAVSEGVKYRDSLGLNYDIHRRTVGRDFNFDEVPLADVTVLSTVHYYFDIDPWFQFLNRLQYKTRYCLVVTRPLPREEHWRPGGEILEVRNYFRNWQEISGISDVSTKGDPHPRVLWSLMFKSPWLERRSVDEIYRKNEKLGTSHRIYREMTAARKEFAEEIAKSDEVNIKETSFYKKWKEREKGVWSEDKVARFVQGKLDVMQDVKKNGQKEPILVKMSGQICDGGHRLEILKALGHKSAIVRYV